VSKSSTSEALLSYFDELLKEEDRAPAARSEQPPADSAAQKKPPVEREVAVETPSRSTLIAPEAQAKRQRVAQEVQQDYLSELEAAKRAQLQTLLNHQISSPTPEIQVAEQPQIIAPPVSEPVAPITAEPADVVVDEEQVELPSINSLLEWAENGRPQWAQERFDVLLFDVSGLTLAVPLIALGQIHNIGENLTPIFGQSEWMMGLLNSPQGQIRTVNTSLFVMPEKYSDNFLETAKYVLTIDGMPWGLAVDSVNQPTSLEPADVKWRSARGSRPWLAGTVKSAMCALIDIPQMGAILQASEHKSIKGD